jgi:hypothetical protein
VKWIPLITIAIAACSASDLPTSPTAPPVDSRWPNEPPGLTLLTDWGFDSELPTSGDVPIPGSPGWHVAYGRSSTSMGGRAERVADAGAPRSPSSVYDFVYPEGMVEGTAPATVYYPFSAREVYVGFWWKPSAPFDVGPNGNKIAFLFNGGGGSGGQMFLMLRTDGRLHVLPEYPGDFRWRTPNLTATGVTLGQWHLIEWYAHRTEGTLKWWLDRRLQGSHTDVTNPIPFDEFQFSPTFGGNTGARKRQTDHYWFDHVYLSAR